MADIPLAVLTATVWAYWFCVGAMIVRVRRKTRRSVGLVPEQSAERALWLVLVPAIVLWLTLPYLALHRVSGLLAVPDFARSEPLYALLRWIAAIVGLGCLAASIKSWLRMGKDWSMAVSEKRNTALITDGLFRYIRHPIYAFQILLMLCTAIVIPNLPVLILAAAHVAVMSFKAHNEERHLLRTHGEDYARYIERTGRFFPRIGPRTR